LKAFSSSSDKDKGFLPLAVGVEERSYRRRKTGEEEREGGEEREEEEEKWW